MSENFDVCTECKKQDDVTPKALFACEYCGLLRCQVHRDARIVYIPTLKGKPLEKTKLGRAILVELQRKNTHPCLVYTRIFWENFDAQSKQELILRNRALDYLAHDPSFTKPTEISVEKEIPIEQKEPNVYHPPSRPRKTEPTTKGPKKPTETASTVKEIGLCPQCHRCSDKIVDYDANTITFQCEYCGFKFSQFKATPHDYIEIPEKPEPIEKPTPIEPTIKQKHFPLKKVITLSIIALIIGVLVWSSPQFLSSNPNSSVSPNPSTTPSVPSTTPSTTPSNTLPQTFSHEELTNYALSLINSDRQSKGLQNVTLSSVDSGQRHADDMLANHFFSHWDTNGYKPYMRYTLAGGKGSVSENGAWYYISEGLDPFKALEKLEYDMVYDDASSNWGHRDNILNAFHNKVSIGIAYDNNDLYFVEDFEDDYVSWSTLSLSNQVQMQGTILKAGQSISQVAIYFDNPMSLTTQQLSNAPYQDGYDAGTYVGMVVSPPSSGYQYSQPDKGILIIANAWNGAGQNFNINFDMSKAFAQCGRGVYTLYLWTDSNNYLTTFSIWN